MNHFWLKEQLAFFSNLTIDDDGNDGGDANDVDDTNDDGYDVNDKDDANDYVDI